MQYTPTPDELRSRTIRRIEPIGSYIVGHSSLTRNLSTCGKAWCGRYLEGRCHRSVTFRVCCIARESLASPTRGSGMIGGVEGRSARAVDISDCGMRRRADGDRPLMWFIASTASRHACRHRPGVHSDHVLDAMLQLRGRCRAIRRKEPPSPRRTADGRAHSGEESGRQGSGISSFRLRSGGRRSVITFSRNRGRGGMCPSRPPRQDRGSWRR